jgi:hypothetical protein
MQMFESAVGAVPEAETRGVQVFDVAELLDMSVTYSKPLAVTISGASSTAASDASEIVQGDPEASAEEAAP